MAVKKLLGTEPPVFQHIGDRVKTAPPRGKYERLSVADRLLILWGLYQGWSVRKIAAALPASPSTVKKFRSWFYEDAGRLFELPVLSNQAGGYQCAFCGQGRKDATAAMRHVLSHFFQPWHIRQLDLEGFQKPV